MVFIVRKSSDHAFEEEREISSIAALMDLTGGRQYELIVSPALLKKHPVILICDGRIE